VTLCIVFVAALAGSQATGAGDQARAAALTAEARRILSSGTLDAFPRAEALLEEALTLFRAAGNRGAEAATLQSLGQAVILRDAAKALAYREAARALWHELGNTAAEAAALHEIGTTLYNRGDIPAALDAFEQSLALARTTGDRDLQATVLSNTANAYTWRGDPQRALDAIDEAAVLWRGLGDKNKESVIQRHRGSIFLRLGDTATALQCFQDALTAAHATGSVLDEGYTLSTMGDAYVQQGDDARALATYTRGLEVWRSIGARRGEAGLIGEIGLLHARRGDYTQALELYRRSLELTRATGFKGAEASTLLNLGALHTVLGDIPSAIEALDASLELWRAVGDRMGEASALVALARAHRARAEPARARDRLDSALAIVESIRGDVRAPDLRGSYLASARRAYEELIDVLMALHHMDPSAGHDAAALLTSERARARSLLDLLTAAHANGPAAAVAAEPLPLDEIRRRVLDDDTVLVEYALGETRSHAWVVTRGSMAAIELAPRARIDAAARRLHRLASAGHKRELQVQLRRALEQASALILAPLGDRLTAKRLVIVPDGALQYVPFAALPVRAAPALSEASRRRVEGGHRDMVLAERYEIVVLPSASAIGAMRQSFDSAKGERLAQGRPVEGPRTVAVVANRRAPSGDAAAQFAPLPFARREADAIAALAGRDDTLLVESGVNRAALAGARIVHFAAHAVLDVDRPERSGIALDSGLLTLKDIYSLQLDADLVVLSACRTALGKEVAGEGLIGLTRGFMYAGARSVVASLWDVSDAATATLMTRFYRRLLVDGFTPSAALRDAQRSMALEPRWSAPYYWAGFVLQGEWLAR
jgi:CHAT domain-containing protein/predicted negative regulator of RcsB-dependent stress response